MKMNGLSLRAAALGALLCLMGSSAVGQNIRSWVSGVGDDANNCSRTAPCKTFAGAIIQTVSGGEIDALDPGGFGGITITKSISLVAVGVVGGVMLSGTNGINVAAGPSDVVILRGLTIDGLLGNGLSPGTAGINGITFSSGKALFIEDCNIFGFNTSGIYIEPQSAGQYQVFISHTVVQNNATHGIRFNPAPNATVSGILDNVRTEYNGGAGVEADGLAGGHATVSLQNVISAGNATGILSNGIGATINMSDVTVFGNTTGLSDVAGGNIISFENNKVVDNGTNGYPTGSRRQE